ncbi:MAG TPA: hypothetical protein V6C84_27820 [Coleofasciculaceae cyanobacterium]
MHQAFIVPTDLANGGTFSVLANLTSQTRLTHHATFSAIDFGLVTYSVADLPYAMPHKIVPHFTIS